MSNPRFVKKPPSGLTTEENVFDGLPAAVLNPNSPSIEGKASKILNSPSPFPVIPSVPSAITLPGIVSKSIKLDNER